jgi:hypothetical protein
MKANDFRNMSSIEQKRKKSPSVDDILDELRENGVDVQVVKISNDNWMKMDMLRKESIQPVSLDN